MHESREKEVAKLIREGMDPAEAQDLVDAQIPEDLESGSDEEEQEEEPESPGDVDFGPDVSPCGTSESEVRVWVHRGLLTTSPGMPMTSPP